MVFDGSETNQLLSRAASEDASAMGGCLRSTVSGCAGRLPLGSIGGWLRIDASDIVQETLA